MQTKICSKCNAEKDISQFSKNRNSTLTVCRDCCYKREKEFYNDHKNKLTKRKSTIKRKYGIEYDSYLSMLTEQGCKCKICQKTLEEFSPKATKPHVDHCHTTGKVRGILCCYCNTMLGVYNDDIKIFENIINYLKGQNE